MNRREKIVFIILGGLLIAGGFWYYARVQTTVTPAVPDNSPVAPTSGQLPELDSEIVVNSLSNVWDLAFLPDETILFTERDGLISKTANGRKVVLHTISDIFARGEGGLMGLAVDPEFDDNRFIYACYNTNDDIRVSRWQVNAAVTELGGQADIVTGMPRNPSGRHSGCRPVFGPDGSLWIGTGDVAIGTHPQDPKSLGGKILRVDRDGQPAEGNLDPPFDARIFSYGHRNTQGLAFFDTTKDGAFGYSVEHGPGRDDEINQLVAGNFGWNPVPGYNESVPMTDKQQYPDAVDAVWSSGSPTIAPSGATIIRGSKWKVFENRLAVAVLKDKHVRLFEFEASGKKVLNERPLFVNEFGRIRSVVMGPNESLYITTDNGNSRDQIIKITPR